MYDSYTIQIMCIGGFRHMLHAPLISTDLGIFNIKRIFSANYKTLHFGPKCQVNAYLAL